MYGRYKIDTIADSLALDREADVKPALNINAADTYWNDYLDVLISGVQDEAEKYCRRAFITSTWDVYFDRFQALIQIIKAPTTSITYIQYQDTDDTTQTLDTSNYTTGFVSEDHAARIKILNAPSIFTDGFEAVNIRFVCGWADANSVPSLLKTAMIVRINDMYKNRQSIYTGTQVNIIPDWYEVMISPYKIDW